MSRIYEQTVTVALSASVSDVFGLRNALSVGINFPVLTSAQAFLRVGQSSAGPFGRMFRTDGSTTTAVNIGAGSAAAMFVDVPFAFAQVEFGVPQAAVRSLGITTRF